MKCVKCGVVKPNIIKAVLYEQLGPSLLVVRKDCPVCGAIYQFSEQDKHIPELKSRYDPIPLTSKQMMSKWKRYLRMRLTK